MKVVVSAPSKVLIRFQVQSSDTCTPRSLHISHELHYLSLPRIHLSFFHFCLESCGIDYMVSEKISHISAKSDKDFEENKLMLKRQSHR